MEKMDMKRSLERAEMENTVNEVSDIFDSLMDKDSPTEGDRMLSAMLTVAVTFKECNHTLQSILKRMEEL